MKKQRVRLGLFLTMLKIGLFTFGGGLAMLALLQNEFVSKKGWMEQDEFMDMVAIAESTPGPIAINSATYIGFKVAGVFGAFLATLAVCIPSFVIIYLISLFFDAFLELAFVAYAFKGVRVAVVYLIFSAGMKLFKEIEKKPLPLCLLALVFVSMILCTLFAVSFSVIFYILIGVVVGIGAYLVTKLSKKGKEDGHDLP